ncbi:acetyl-CoA synthetase-like protein [Lindgomyces ingoldianus]|uniref:Acetyl-CoA synthetase-like protein n=1 Tax=Lindgomyces ingoldianus TaxID=673940 RepID=A0ACB6QP39_9PLEO|nr:acetyl-CoA synthetase-like protein [Lindgomyces ingoldianus]KAF2468738.1 acetyl-CoA synthetase-like protein [Lindgomyces ingoldianus]
MVFKSPPWVPQGLFEIPETLPVGEFALIGRPQPSTDLAPRPVVTCGLSDKSYTRNEVKQRVDLLSRSLCKELGWSSNVGSPSDKVVAIFSLNTIEYMILCWAVHRVNGICLPLHSSSSVAEITHHMKLARCSTIFTCWPLLSTCLQAADQLALDRHKIYLIDLPHPFLPDDNISSNYRFLNQLVEAGRFLDPVESLSWEPGQGTKQIAYLCSTSGTAGKQKLAKITHFNVIANVLQATIYEDVTKKGRSETATGVLPMSHAYGLEVAHIMLWRNDRLIVHPQFDMQAMIVAISKYHIQRLYLVPPIIVALISHSALLKKHDISSVTTVVSGAAPLNEKVARQLQELCPSWEIIQAYGLTETSIIATLTSPYDVYLGSSGCLLPHVQARLEGPDGSDIDNYDQPGEVLIASPSVFVGYLGDTEAHDHTFDPEGWLRTGDIGVIKTSPKGSEHLFIVDRLKDMIKVKGSQVAPAEIEAQLLQHPAIIDAAVIGTADETSGEVALAFVVRSPNLMVEASETELRRSISSLIESNLSSIHWLGDRITFIEKVPRSPSGKILKKELRTICA